MVCSRDGYYLLHFPGQRSVGRSAVVVRSGSVGSREHRSPQGSRPACRVPRSAGLLCLPRLSSSPSPTASSAPAAGRGLKKAIHGLSSAEQRLIVSSEASSEAGGGRSRSAERRGAVCPASAGGGMRRVSCLCNTNPNR